MKQEIIIGKIVKAKRRHQFLFNDGEFKPRLEKSAKSYRRKEKYPSKNDVELGNW